jgi:hypothetical protein
MKTSLATSLGLIRLDALSKQEKIITFGVWANTHNSGSYHGVRDAMPGFLQVIPHMSVDENFEFTAESVEKLLRHSDKRVIFPFSVLHGSSPRIRWSVPGDMGMVLDSIKPVTWPYDIEDVVLDHIKDFDFNKTMELLYTQGPQTVVTRNSDGIISGVCGCLSKIKASYGYSHMLHTNINKISSSDISRFGDAECRLTFLKPSQCLPFFGENHGAVIHLTVSQEKACKSLGKFFPLFEMVGLFTDNTGAFCNVDGDENLYGSSTPFVKATKTIKDCTFAFNRVGGMVASAGKT